MKNLWDGTALIDVAETPNGGLIVTGRSDDTLSGGDIVGNVWILKVDSMGCFDGDCGEEILLALEEIDEGVFFARQ